MTIWRNDWERATAGGRSWKVQKTAEVESLLTDLGSGRPASPNMPRALPPEQKLKPLPGGPVIVDTSGEEARVLGRAAPTFDSEGYQIAMKKAAAHQKVAEDDAGDEEAPTEVDREDTGRGVNFGRLFDPRHSDRPGEVPQVDPLLKMQKAQALLGQQLMQVVQGMSALTQQVQQSQQGGQQPPQQGGQDGTAQAIEQLQASVQAIAQQLGIQLPGAEGQGGEQGPPPEGEQGPPPSDAPPGDVGPDGITLPAETEAEMGGEDAPLQLSDEGGDYADDPQVPEGLEFDPEDDDEAYAQRPKRALPPQPGESFSTPGGELAAGLPPMIRFETAIKHSSLHISPIELAKELNEAYGHEWMDMEWPALAKTWAADHPDAPLDAETANKIQGLQALFANTTGFWSHYPLFRDVVLVLNGAPPLLDQPEEQDSVSPGQIAYGAYVASTLAPFSKVGMPEPGEEVKRYVALILLQNGLVVATFPLKWAQPALDAFVQQYANGAPEIDRAQVRQRLAAAIDQPLDQVQLNENDPNDLQVAQLLAIQQYVTEMEG